MGEKLHDRLKEVLKVNNELVMSDQDLQKAQSGEAAQGKNDPDEGNMPDVLAENLLAKNFQEEMAFLATQKLHQQEEVIPKESHFFKT